MRWSEFQTQLLKWEEFHKSNFNEREWTRFFTRPLSRKLLWKQQIPVKPIFFLNKILIFIECFIIYFLLFISVSMIFNILSLPVHYYLLNNSLGSTPHSFIEVLSNPSNYKPKIINDSITAFIFALGQTWAISIRKKKMPKWEEL